MARRDDLCRVREHDRGGDEPVLRPHRVEYQDEDPIADPTNTEVNQAYLEYGKKDWANLMLKGGRQEILLDDWRFVGNVIWRQNRQSFDAARGSSSLGLDDLVLDYSYLGYIRRVFGDQDDRVPSDTRYGATRDWQSNSHLINVSYKGIDWIKPTAFVYLLDLEKENNVGANTFANGVSSASYGWRVTGAPKIGEDLTLAYAASYAYQTDYGDNPTDYGAHYVWADLKLKWDKLGAIGGGYELLGSDDGMARFVTPLATAHKFNGWADVFINNGGTNGLQDIFASISPKLPWGFKTSLVYHHFRSSHGGNALGNEFDTLLKRKFGDYLTLLFKSAYFNAYDNSGLPDIWRVTMQAGLKF